MDRIIKPIEEKYLRPSLKLVETVFLEWDSPEEGRMVRALVEEIRAKKYYVPALDLVMLDSAEGRQTNTNKKGTSSILKRL